MKLRSSVLVISALGVALSGCGGSGSQGNETPASGNIYTGVVIDGHLQGATVFADINRNGVKDPGEPATVTDSNGKYTLRAPANIYQPPVVVDVPETAIDSDTGKPVGKYYRLTAADGVYSVISPLSTMVRALMDVHPGLTRNDAELMVRGYFALSGSYDLNVDYTLKDAPAGASEEKWAQFLAESGRAHNIARIAAVVMATYWGNANAAYGGRVLPEKLAMVNSLLAVQTLKQIAPLAATLPNKGLVDLDTLKVDIASVSSDKLDADIRKITLGADMSLTQVIESGELHLLPFKTAAANYAHFVLKNGGATNTSINISDKSIKATSSVLLPDLSETYDHSLQVMGNGRQSLFQGALKFEASTHEDILRDPQMTTRWRVNRLPIAGEQQGLLYDPSWLKNPYATWPDNAIAYKAIVKTAVLGATLYEENSARQYAGKLPDKLYSDTDCCGINAAKGLQLGDLVVRFSPPVVDAFTGPRGTTNFALLNGATSTPLDIKGSWALNGSYVDLDIPADYRGHLKDLANDRLFSVNSTPNIVLLPLNDTQYAVGLHYPEGRYLELIMLNSIAYEAIKTNLKW